MESESLTERFSGFYSGLTDREQKLLKVAGVIVPLLLISLVIGLFYQSLGSIESRVTQYQQGLDLMRSIGPRFQAQNSGGSAGNKWEQRLSEDKITDNDIKMTSFVATHAAATDISVSSYDEDERAMGSQSSNDEGPTTVKTQLNVTIRQAELDKLVNLLQRIETSDKPVFIERIKLSSVRDDKGLVRASVVVSTFRKKAAS